MKYIFLFLLLLLSGLVYSQRDFKLSISFGKNYGNRLYKFAGNTNNAPINRDIADWNYVQDSTERPIYNSQFGVELEKRIFKKLFISTGLSIKRLGTKSLHKDYFKYNYQGTPLYLYYSEPIVYYDYFYYYSVPLKVKYYLINTKVDIGLYAGVSYNRLFKQKIGNIPDLKHSDWYKMDPLTNSWDLLGGVCFDYSLLKNFKVGLDVYYVKALNPNIKIAATSEMLILQQIQEYYNYFGLDLKISYCFK